MSLHDFCKFMTSENICTWIDFFVKRLLNFYFGDIIAVLTLTIAAFYINANV